MDMAETPVRESLLNEKLRLEIADKNLDIRVQERTLYLMDRTIDSYDREDLMFVHRTYVDELSLDRLQSKVDRWLEIGQRYQQPVQAKVLLTSPGGSVFHGLAHYDLIKNAVNSGIEIETCIQGYAASAASAYAQAGSKRTITPNSWLMIHEAGHLQHTLMGLAEMKDQYELLGNLQAQLIRMYAERSHMSGAEISERIVHRAWWITSEQALEYGFVDEIVRSSNGTV